VVVGRNASWYLRLDARVPAKDSLGIGDAPLILLLTINIRWGGVPVFLLQHAVGEEWVLLEVLQYYT